ncbi:MAG TPA: D-alanine--D-alanine ligase family protein [Acidimicrobiia bacterium]|nr:D-alanine--D-alanine ligase family protein [Acidimicrobiia bacterium]
MTRTRVLLLFGGRSAEHDVSRVSAVAVARALDPERYDVVPVGITKEGRWLLAEEARAAIEQGPDALPTAFEVGGPLVAELPDPGRPELVSLDAAGDVLPGGFAFDVVIPMLHGPYGEDGTVQGLLELAGVPYVGSGVVGSAVGMDKVMMKRAFAAAGLPVANWLAAREWDADAAFLDEVEANLGFPCFVKPANMGSSVGVSKALDRPTLEAAVATALVYDEWVVVEEAVAGREIEVAVLGDRPPEASLPGEVVPGDEFYSYADKYEGDAAQLLIPAPLGDAETAAVRRMAVDAFLSCRCEAMARVDFFYEEGGRGFLVNEVNTLPGFTPISMYPMLWEASGVPYPALMDRLVALAVERHERRARRAGRQRGLPDA